MESKSISIRRGQVYTQKEVIAVLHIARETLDCWVGQGLRYAMPGTKQKYFLGDHVIAFLFENDSR